MVSFGTTDPGKGERMISVAVPLSKEKFSKETLSHWCAVLLAFVIPISTAGTHMVLSLLMCAWVVSGNLKEKVHIIKTHPVSRGAIWLFALFLLGALYSEGTQEDIVRQLGKMSKLLYIPFLLPLMRSVKWRYLVLMSFVSAMMLALLLGMLKMYGVVAIGLKFGQACVFRDHIYTSFMMALACFFLGHSSLGTQKELQKLLFMSLVAMNIYYLFFVNTGRTGQIICIGLWGLFCLQRFAWKGRLVGLLALGAIILLASMNYTPLQSHINTVVQTVEEQSFEKMDNSLLERIAYAKNSWKLAWRHPWFGSGTGSFNQVYKESIEVNNEQTTKNPHNEYLNIFVQLGMIGLLVVLMLMGALIKLSFRLPKPERWFAHGLLLSFSMGCMANSWLMDSASGYLFILLVAVFYAALNDGATHDTH